MNPNPPNFDQIMNQGMNGMQGPPAEMFAGIFLFVVLAVLLVVFVIQAVICIFLSKPLKVVPEPLRSMSPGLVWLLMIPCFPVIWNFFVFPKVSQSLKRFANTQGNQMVGDCGETLGWIFCGLWAGSFIGSAAKTTAPLLGTLGSLCGLAALVIVIIYLIKVNTIAGQLRMGAMQPPIANMAPPEQYNNDNNF